VNALWINL